MFCPKCGAQVNENGKFCGSCGYQFAASEDTVVNQEAVQPEPIQPEPIQPEPIQPEPVQEAEPIQETEPVQEAEPIQEAEPEQPVYQAPVETVPEQPVYQAPAEPQFEQPVYGAAQPEQAPDYFNQPQYAPQKKDNKKLFISLGAGAAAIILIVVILIIVLSGGGYKDALDKFTKVGEGEFQYISELIPPQLQSEYSPSEAIEDAREEYQDLIKDYLGFDIDYEVITEAHMDEFTLRETAEEIADRYEDEGLYAQSIEDGYAVNVLFTLDSSIIGNQTHNESYNVMKIDGNWYLFFSTSGRLAYSIFKD